MTHPFEFKPDVEARLNEAWKFLCGVDWPFRRMFRHDDASALNRLTALLPVTLAGALGGACRLVISPDNVRQVASNLFGVPASELSEADVEDALREACNVLGSCVASAIPAAFDARIGIPMVVTDAPEAQSASASRNVRARFHPEAQIDPRLDVLIPSDCNNPNQVAK